MDLKYHDVSIRKVDLRQLKVYADQNYDPNQPDYLSGLLDKVVFKALLTDPKFNKTREAWGAFIVDDMIGYVIVYRPDDLLDQLHVAEDHRRKGIATALIKHLDIQQVVVNRSNTQALSAYRSLGLDIIFDDE